MRVSLLLILRSSCASSPISLTLERTENAVITSSDATIVRSLLRKTQAVVAQLVTAATKDPYALTTKDAADRIRFIDAYTTVAIRYMMEE